MTARGLRIVPDRARQVLPEPVAIDRKTTGKTTDGEHPPTRQQLPGQRTDLLERPDWAGTDSMQPDIGASDIGSPDIGSTATYLAPTAAEREWTARAVCATADPDLLFVTGAAQREAARLCRGCPVQMECLADALDNQVEFGVWGGLTERQRRALLKRRPDVTSWRAVLEQARAEATSTVAS